MFGITQEKLLIGLTQVNKQLCDYTLAEKHLASRCDCKFGIQLNKLKQSSGEENGCPEVRLASKLLAALSVAEYKALAVKAGIILNES